MGLPLGNKPAVTLLIACAAMLERFSTRCILDLLLNEVEPLLLLDCVADDDDEDEG